MEQIVLQLIFKWLASPMETDMASNDPFMSPNCCIFKTPTILSMHNEKAYVPRAFSIGPFHHNDPKLVDTQKIKKNYLHGLISRSPSPETKLRDLINSINEVQTEARECYSKPIGYSPEEFVKILVIDGCFIIELFRKMALEVFEEDNDPVFTIPCMREFLYHDLILLENQVPWMVLERLYSMTMDSVSHPMRDLLGIFPVDDHEALISFAIGYFNRTFPIYRPTGGHKKMDRLKHIPDLMIKWMVLSIGPVEERRSWFDFSGLRRPLGTILPTPIGEEGLKQMPSATSLVEAGIKFRRVENKSILDIEFKDGVLKIPPLLIYHTTETVLRNLISFEQCYPNCEARFTSYAILINNLINTAKDVEILSENKIIDNWLNPQDAVPFFNKLYHNTRGNHYYYHSLSMDVNSYCQRWWPSWRAALVRSYLHTPWAIFSAMAAIILLILSLLQTVYTMKK